MKLIYKSFLFSFLFISFSVFTQAEDEFDVMRKRIVKEYSLGSLNYDTTDIAIQKYVQELANKARKYQESMLMSPVSCLWTDLPSLVDVPAYTCFHVHHSYRRLLIMTQAWAYPTSTLHHNDSLLISIKKGLDFLYSLAYNENTKPIGNWWEWRIGIPKAYAYIVSILYDELSTEQVQQYELGVKNQIREFTQNGNMTFANQASICRNLLFLGILTKNSDDIKTAINSSVRAFYDNTTIAQRKAAQASYEDILARQSTYQHSTIVWKKEGLYEDGTFIQHIAMPYIGTYGVEIVELAAVYAKLLVSTSYSVPQTIIDILPTWIERAYLPAIYKGEMLLMFMGRGVLRDPYFYALRAALSIFDATNLLSSQEQKKRIYDELCKYDFSLCKRNPIYGNPIIDNPKIEQIINTGDITAPNQNFNIVLAAGDRVIHQTKNFRLGLAMSSRRIGKYEAFKRTDAEENLQGWYSADGMTYLYNDNERCQYLEYFASVNPYHMPGTTVDLKVRERQPAGMVLFGQRPDAPAWVGGASTGKFGVAGMQLASAISDMKAKKSWFMFDNEIVCIGSDISLSEQREVLTIIENRKSESKLQIDTFVWNAENLEIPFDYRPTYIHLDKTGGYYFPESQRVYIDRTPSGHTELYFSHGLAPQKATYSYVLLPTASLDAIRQYASSPDIQILANTETLQAVEESKLHILAANFWSANGGQVKTAYLNIKCDGESSLICEYKDKDLKLYVSDPTWLRKTQNIVIKDKYTLIHTNNPDKVTVRVKGNKTYITINCADQLGMTTELLLANQ